MCDHPLYRATPHTRRSTKPDNSHTCTIAPATNKQDLLRYELGFDGFLVTDYGEINGLHGEHAIAKDNREAVRGLVGLGGRLWGCLSSTAVSWLTDRLSPSIDLAQPQVKIAMRDTSIDMSMTAWDTDFARDLIDLVNKGELPMERLDESVARCVRDPNDICSLYIQSSNPTDLPLSPTTPTTTASSRPRRTWACLTAPSTWCRTTARSTPRLAPRRTRR